MKLINGGIKDYYDYLVGIKGIDDHVVFDRRGPNVIETNCLGNVYFATVPLYNDKERQNKRSWCSKVKKYVKRLIGEIYYFTLEIGFTHYVFKVERYVEDGKLVLKPELLEKKTVESKLMKDSIISIIPFTATFYRFLSDKSHISYHLQNAIDLPILRDTYIPSFIKPDEIYDEIYNYILSTKEPKIVDNRNDVQKLESRGFDKKTSFRKM